MPKSCLSSSKSYGSSRSAKVTTRSAKVTKTKKKVKFGIETLMRESSISSVKKRRFVRSRGLWRQTGAPIRYNLETEKNKK